MEKSQIKLLLKESLDKFFSMDEGDDKNPSKSTNTQDNNKGTHKPNKNSTNQGEGGKRDYADVRRAFEKLGGPSMVDAMKLMGISDDEKGTNRSLFRKKVKQIKNNETGSYYQFSDEELNQVRAALDIQN